MPPSTRFDWQRSMKSTSIEQAGWLTWPIDFPDLPESPDVPDEPEPDA